MSKILLVEDEAAIRRTLSVGLMQEGYEVDPCEDGLTGITKVNNYSESGQNLDLVILDINLPDINGLKVLRFIKEKYPTLPVILITGYGNEAIEEEVKENKGDAYLEKPLDLNKLDEYLKNLISQKDDILGKKETAATVKSGYAFIRLGDPDLATKVYQKLYFHKNVMYCDATRGVYDMILLLHGETLQELESIVSQISKIKGVTEIFFAQIEKPVLSEDTSKIIAKIDQFLIEDNSSKEYSSGIGKCVCSAYALLEIELEKFEKVYRSVYFLDNVVSTDTLKGPYRLALLLKAPTGREIEDVVVNRLAKLDGVLRVTHCPVINIMET